MNHNFSIVAESEEAKVLASFYTSEIMEHGVNIISGCAACLKAVFADANNCLYVTYEI